MIDHNSSTTADDHAEEKKFATLAAEYALAGHPLVRKIGADGKASYFCTCWGLIKRLANLEAARAFLAQIGGAQ